MLELYINCSELYIKCFELYIKCFELYIKCSELYIIIKLKKQTNSEQSKAGRGVVNRQQDASKKSR